MIPKKYRASFTLQLDSLVKVLTLLSVVAFVFLYVSNQMTIKKIKIRHKNIKSSISLSEKNIKSLDEMLSFAGNDINLNRNNDPKKAQEEKKLVRKTSILSLILELNSIIPQDAWFAEILIKENTGLVGYSLEGEGYLKNRKLIPEIVSKLKHSTFFKNAYFENFKNSKTYGPEVLSFNFKSQETWLASKTISSTLPKDKKNNEEKK